MAEQLCLCNVQQPQMMYLVRTIESEMKEMDAALGRVGFPDDELIAAAKQLLHTLSNLNPCSDNVQPQQVIITMSDDAVLFFMELFAWKKQQTGRYSQEDYK